MIKRLSIVVLCIAGIVANVLAQQIRNHYVSKAEQDGTIYHTFPCTLFESRTEGALTFDITYKEHRDGMAVINFTYTMERPTPVDSVRFVSGLVALCGPAEKIYLEPGKRAWKHRYSFRAPIESLCAFFDERATPSVSLSAAGQTYVYPAKRSAWRSYAPIGFRIFEMIRVNEGDRAVATGNDVP